MLINKYQKIQAQFKPWSQAYLIVANQLIKFIQTTELEVIHIGSTSAMVGGKGIIDLSLLYDDNFTEAVERLKMLGFQDQVSQKPFPDNRPRKDGSVIVDGEEYFIHVHVIKKGSEEHKKQLQYKEYMLNNPDERIKYENSKKAILAKGINEQEAYGKLKSPFIKSVLTSL